MEGPPVCKLSQASCQIERRFVGVVVVIELSISSEIFNDGRSNYNTKSKILKGTKKANLHCLSSFQRFWFN
jgi:hypothetical protein